MDWAQTSRVRRDPMSDLRPEQIIALVAPLVVIQPGLAGDPSEAIRVPCQAEDQGRGGGSPADY